MLDVADKTVVKKEDACCDSRTKYWNKCVGTVTAQNKNIDIGTVELYQI